MNLDVFEKHKGIKIKLSTVEKPYVCQYCSSAYVKESTLTVHMCEQKRRHLAKDEKHVLLGYQTYVRFFQLTQKAKYTKTYEEFAKSPYYNAFVKFGSFLSNVKPLYPEKYVNYIVKSGVKLDDWCKESLYETYAVDLIMKEGVETALERSITTMMDWADENDSVWNHYFNYVSLNRAVWHIKDGKISPWLILNSKSGKDMLSKLNDEQLGMIYHIMNPEHWAMRFRKSPSDVELVKEVAKESNL